MKNCLLCRKALAPSEFYVCQECREKYALMDHESEFLNKFLDISFNEYTDEARSICMSSSTEAIVRNCRKILNDIIIEMYSESVKPLDLLAVALTYARKYSADRPLAIRYFEEYLQNPVSIPANPHFAWLDGSTNSKRPAYSLWSIYSTFAKIYKAEKEYDKSIKCLEECIRHDNGTNPADFTRIEEIKRLRRT